MVTKYKLIRYLGITGEGEPYQKDIVHSNSLESLRLWREGVRDEDDRFVIEDEETREVIEIC